MSVAPMRAYPGNIPEWFLGIVEKYVAPTHRDRAVYEYLEANRRQPLTPKQVAILRFIRDHIAFEGYAPSYEELAAQFGLRSLASVAEHLGNLERKGWIERRHNEARSITLTGPTA